MPRLNNAPVLDLPKEESDEAEAGPELPIAAAARPRKGSEDGNLDEIVNF